MPMVRSGALAFFEKQVFDLGENPLQIIRDAGLYQAQLRDPDTYIDYARMADLLELAAWRCEEPFFALRLAKRQSVDVLGDLPVLASSAETVAEALERVNHYLYLHASGVSLVINRGSEHTKIELNVNVEAQFSLNQLMQLSIYHLALFASGLVNKDPTLFTLYLQQEVVTQPEKGQVALQQVRFGQDFNGIIIRTDELNGKNYQDKEALNRLLERHLHELETRYPGRLKDQVSNLMARLIITGECSIDQIATALGLHPRTLQSRLKQENTNYQTLLRKVRQSRAEERLQCSQSSITDIALQLGYADVAIFSRHFKKWSGMTPSKWRQKRKRSQSSDTD